MKFNIDNKKIYLSGVALWLVVLLLVLGVKGYQPVQCREFTEQEMIDIAVQRTLDKIFSVSSGLGTRKEGIDLNTGKRKFSRKKNYLPYKNVAHFIGNNPDCCKVQSANNWQTGGHWVYAGGKVYYLDEEGQERTDQGESISTYLFIPRCVRYYP